MNIRSLNQNDISAIKLIHARFFADEFEFPDFFHNFLCAFLVEDEVGNIISAGGVKTITESIIITNKDVSVRTRYEALNKMLQASIYTCNRTNHDQLHAFIQDESWLHHLYKNGFRNTIGKSIVMDV